jgi:uncharacterized protein involved in type VI secretion and phage assembly
MMVGDFRPDGSGGRYFGVYPAIVTAIDNDDENIGRIEVKFPWLGKDGEKVRALATLCTPYADDDQGIEILPAVDTQVVVAFEAGDLRRPYIIGACWNGKEKLPAKPEKPNNKRLIKTRAKTLLEFDDTKGSAKVTLSMEDGSGHSFVLEQTPATITLNHKNGSFIKIESSGNITIFAQGTLLLHASSVTVDAPSTTHSGSITCMAHTATSVTSPLYSQGAGQIW